MTQIPARSSMALPETLLPISTNSRFRVTGSPMRTSFSVSSLGNPTSTKKSVSFSGALASSAVMICTGFNPGMRTPGRSWRPWTTTRWATRVRGSKPPTGLRRRNPLSSIWATMKPISSMWPLIIIFLAPVLPFLRAMTLPMASTLTSSASFSSSSLTTARILSSRPGIPGVWESFFSSSTVLPPFSLSLSSVFAPRRENSCSACLTLAR